jgi:hypothetical protein
VVDGLQVFLCVRPRPRSNRQTETRWMVNPSISILRSRCNPNDAPLTNLHTGPHRSFWIQQEDGGGQDFTPNEAIITLCKEQVVSVIFPLISRVRNDAGLPLLGGFSAMKSHQG